LKLKGRGGFVVEVEGAGGFGVEVVMAAVMVGVIVVVVVPPPPFPQGGHDSEPGAVRPLLQPGEGNSRKKNTSKGVFHLFGVGGGGSAIKKGGGTLLSMEAGRIVSVRPPRWACVVPRGRKAGRQEGRKMKEGR
jgi:hypothetical protein